MTILTTTFPNLEALGYYGLHGGTQRLVAFRLVARLNDQLMQFM